ncbi:MAG TPA: GNAT family N-acetyltransferase [Candidatus Acidoferrales bacterium]|nr:GNAT family N-acetyltransferase [Candidatus Acidoferrales bacterium]
MEVPFTQPLIRPATHEDVEALRHLIEVSARALQAQDYSADQIEAAIGGVFGVDTTLIDDGTYFVVEIPPGKTKRAKLVGCGGWSRRKTLFGGDQWHEHNAALLDPAHEAAKIRAFFVHPSWARRGIGTLILDACERAAVAAGFRRLEMVATLTGARFYAARGYEQRERFDVQLGNGRCIEVVRMEKPIT